MTTETLCNGPTRGRSLVLGLVTAMLLAGCSHMPGHMPKIHWPFGKKPVPVPQSVVELPLQSSTGESITYPQFWERNTLVIDLQGAAADGAFQALPNAERGWPVRISLRLRPGSTGSVEVHGAERVVFPIITSGPPTITLSIPVSTYNKTTQQLKVSWGAASAPIP